MQINKITIENFRSISEKVFISGNKSKLKIFVGANNTGKSNILRAINLFFNKECEPGVLFKPNQDLNKYSANPINIYIELQFSNIDDKYVTRFIDKNCIGEFSDYLIKITCICYGTGSMQYSFTNIKGQKKDMPELLNRIMEFVNCVYIPAIKDYKTIINNEMMKKIVAATFHSWGRGIKTTRRLSRQREDFQRVLHSVQKILNTSSAIVSGIVKSVVPTINKFDFSLPYDNLEEFLGKIKFELSEVGMNEKVSLDVEGSGIQSFTIYSMLKLLYEIRPRSTDRKSQFIWLIEEPETFMHHDLQRKTFAKLKEYSDRIHIFLTTHSPVFIDKVDYNNTYSVEKDKTTKLKLVNVKNIMNVIGGNLGVSFQDLFMFNRFNILVEGESDKYLLEKLNELFKQNGDSGMLDLNNVELISCKSANGIKHFFHLYSVFNQYGSFFALFDRDKSGVECRNAMLKDKVDAKWLLIIPQSDYKKNNAIEDIVDKDVWEQCLGHLDDSGLIVKKIRQNKIVDYEFDNNCREAVKTEFSKKLIMYANQDLSKFLKYRELLQDLNKRIQNE
jgi:predicted ATP-dependent endonuclease of OLD family